MPIKSREQRFATRLHQRHNPLAWEPRRADPAPGFALAQKRLGWARVHCRFTLEGLIGPLGQANTIGSAVMIMQLAAASRRRAVGALLVLGMTCVAGPVTAQRMTSIDPDAAIDGDLDSPQPRAGAAYPAPEPRAEELAPAWQDPVVTSAVPTVAASQAWAAPAAAAVQGDTYKEDDLIGAAEDVFGKGAEGLARVIQNVLSKQGEPNAYIVGREAGGAFIVGARYGSGTLFHKVEGQRPVYWTGPSIGLDAGANAGSTFVLVYNLYDSEQLYERYPAGEGQAYLVGGFNASYLRKDDVVLIPIRVGAGLRLGVNAGYMKFSKKQRWLPF
jgi:hypothetical protein